MARRCVVGVVGVRRRGAAAEVRRRSSRRSRLPQLRGCGGVPAKHARQRGAVAVGQQFGRHVFCGHRFAGNTIGVRRHYK